MNTQQVDRIARHGGQTPVTVPRRWPPTTRNGAPGPGISARR